MVSGYQAPGVIQMSEQGTAEVHRALWMGLLSMARCVRYYDILLSSSKRFRNTVRILLVLFGTGAFVSFLNASMLPMEFMGTVGFLLAVIVVVDLVLDPCTSTANLSVITVELRHLEDEYRHIWEIWNAGCIDIESAQSKSAELTAAACRITSRVASSENKRVNKKSAKIAYEVELHRYAS